MLFEKTLASLGVGAAKIDTRLEKSQVQAGEVLKGEVFIQGGQVEQRVDDIYLYLIVHYAKNNKLTQHVLRKYQLCERFYLQPGEYKIIPFEIRIPYEAPMTTGRFPAYLKTGLDIKNAIDPTDKDKIEVFPHPTVERMLGEIEKADFILYRIDNEYEKDMKPHPFLQVFQFRPTGRYHGFLDELNLIFDVTNHDVRMDVEIVRGTRVLTSCFHWLLSDPNGTLVMDNGIEQQRVSSPVEIIQSLLKKN
ncbi:sporulation-control protein spo0M [Polycladomyces abyssicola]|uniref:Sporulation-control protein spo0M n=1 Tax=Polycladomyces abyssicola TaxID=1125966 RepID=A0A8D5UIZ1_9BACL|nr:sporulation protein [Polycladomyces abyssicola]BCU82928.1 sporulation-control protein spo0M [Polycladomyces abyssicola]